MKKIAVYVVVFILIFSAYLNNVSIFADTTSSLPKLALSCIPQCNSAFLSWEKCPGAISYTINRNGKQIAFLSYELDKYQDFFTSDSDSVTYRVSALDSNDKPIAVSYLANMTNRCIDDENCKTHLEYRIGDYMYRVDGVMEGPMEVAPEVTKGRTFLVIRYVTEPIGATIGWNGAERKVTIETKSGKKIELWVGKSTAKVDGESVPIDPDNREVVPYVKNGRTLLPLRFSAENLGADGENGVVWHSEDKRIELNVLDESCKEIPYKWLLDVNEYDTETDTLVCQNDFGVAFELTGKDVDLSTLNSDDRISISGEITEYEFGLNPVVVCSKFENIQKGMDEPEWIYGIVTSVECEDGGYNLSLTDSKGGVHSYKTNLPLVCSLTPDTWIKFLVIGDKLHDWRYVIDEIIEDVSESFGPTMLKIISVDTKEQLLDFNDYDDFIENGLRAEKITYRYHDADLMDQIELRRCYLVSGIRNQAGFSYVTSFEEIPCPPNFEIELAHSPERAISGVQGVISIEVTNHNDFERRYESIFTGSETGGLFRPKQSSFKVDSRGSFVAKFNFISGYDFEGVATFTVGVSCDGVEKTLDVSVLFEKPQIHLETSVSNYTIKQGRNVYTYYRVRNDSELKIKAETFIEALDFPGEVTLSQETVSVQPSESAPIKINISINEDAPPNTKHAINYGIIFNEFILQETIIITIQSRYGPELTIEPIKVNRKKIARITGEVDWLDFEPGYIEVNWDSTDRDIIMRYESFPIEYEMPCSGDFIVDVTAYTATGESATQVEIIEVPGLKPEFIVIREVEDGDHPNEFIFNGRVNWNGLEEGTITMYWDDGSVCHGLPCRNRFIKKWFLYFALVEIKAASGEKLLEYVYFLRGDD